MRMQTHTSRKSMCSTGKLPPPSDRLVPPQLSLGAFLSRDKPAQMEIVCNPQLPEICPYSPSKNKHPQQPLMHCNPSSTFLASPFCLLLPLSSVCLQEDLFLLGQRSITTPTIRRRSDTFPLLHLLLPLVGSHGDNAQSTIVNI